MEQVWAKSLPAGPPFLTTRLPLDEASRKRQQKGMERALHPFPHISMLQLNFIQYGAM
jgi:hypothetical protein